MFKTIQESDIKAALNLLNHSNNDDLKELLNDDDKFENLLKDIRENHFSYFKELETEKEMLIASNRSLAEFNLLKQPELEENKQLLKELSERGQELCTTVNDKLDAIQQKSGTMSVDTALDLLQAAAAEIEQDSEEVSEKFLAGDMEVDEFLDQFLSRRKIMHSRKVKVDKMRELLKKSTVSSHFPGIAPAVPYPIGPVSIPMPHIPMYTSY